MRVAPVAHLGDLLGFIVAERRATDTDFDEEEDRVLADLARQLGLALHNVRLDSALQASLDELQVRNTQLVASRARIVAAADESRRRIERNLHDGAQQHLVAMAVKVGLARQLLDADAATAATMLEELREDVQVTLDRAARAGPRHLPAVAADPGPARGAAGGRQPGGAADERRGRDAPALRSRMSRPRSTSVASRRCRTRASTPAPTPSSR